MHYSFGNYGCWILYLTFLNTDNTCIKITCCSITHLPYGSSIRMTYLQMGNERMLHIGISSSLLIRKKCQAEPWCRHILCKGKVQRALQRAQASVLNWVKFRQFTSLHPLVTSAHLFDLEIVSIADLNSTMVNILLIEFPSLLLWWLLIDWTLVKSFSRCSPILKH